MSKIITLDNGLRLVFEEIPYVQSVTAGIWVRAGCVDEDDSCRGISHFIEHMMFKGTSTRTARELASDFDALGAQTNAFTSKESTCYYVRSLSSNVDQTCDLLLDMIMDSQFEEKEMAREKQVVKEEIKMSEDSPDDYSHDLLYNVLFPGDPLSGSILGTPEDLDRISRQDILSYLEREYTLDNIVVSVSGNFDETQIRQQMESRLHGLTPSKPRKKVAGSAARPSFVTKTKDIEQSHICLGTRALNFDHEDTCAMAVLNNIMGGSMSSRLFQNIREEKGMAYTVYSYNSAHDQDGFYAISAGVAHDKIEDTVNAVREELEKLTRDGVTDRELAISKEQMKSSILFSMENTSSRMVSNGKFVLMRNRVRSLEEAIQEIDAVTQDDIRRMIALIGDLSTYSGSLVSRRDLDLGSLIG